MTLIQALELATNYPGQILVTSAKHKASGKHALFIYMLRGDNIHKLMVSSEATFKTKKEAELYGHNYCKAGKKYVASLSSPKTKE